MLSELVVEGLGVIDHAELDLTEGSSALTGETGAGKTLVVAALGLLVGARADRGLVRSGSKRAHVDARFSLSTDDALKLRLDELGLDDPENDEVLLSRTIDAAGKSKARVNGRPVTLSVLQEIGTHLLEIAGQSEHHRLSQAGEQRMLLDAFGGLQDLARAAEDAVRELNGLTSELEALQSSERDRARELDVLRFEIAEIEGVGPRAGESDELTREAARLEHADAIASGLAEALDRLRGDRGVGELLPGASAELRAIADKDPSLEPLAARLDTAAIEVSDISEELTRISVPADPAVLATTRDRLGVLARLRRKYGATDEAVLAYLERCRTRAAEVENATTAEEDLVARVAEAREMATSAADRLSAARREAAPRLAAEVEGTLAGLALADARFEVELEQRDLYSGGNENVLFKVAANPGEVVRPIAKVASGGELSRIALALRLLTSSGTASTMVFDEVDAGVGGEAARAVGRCLSELGKRAGAQVLVVTHLPQVAAFADHQYVVSKGADEGRTTSIVEKVEGEARVEELSRMLSGLPESERAREHAQELLELAVRQGQG